LIQSFQHYDKKLIDLAVNEDYGIEIADLSFASNIEKNKTKILKFYESKLKDFKGIISFHGVFHDINVTSMDPLILKVVKARIIDNIRTAIRLNAKFIIFHTNFFPLILNETYKTHWINANAKFWKEIIKKYNITVLLENMFDTEPDLILKLMNKVNSNKFKVCLDLGHYNVFSKVPLEEWIKKLREHIKYLHLNDNLGDRDSELPVGKGNIQWKKFTNLLQKYNLKPYVTIEVENYIKTKKSIDYMKKNKIHPFD